MDFIKVNTPSRKIQLAMLFSNMVSGKDLEGLLNAIGKLKLIETQGKTVKNPNRYSYWTLAL